MQITIEYLEQVLKNIEMQRQNAQAQADEYTRGAQEQLALVNKATGAAALANEMLHLSRRGGEPKPADPNAAGGANDEPFIAPEAQGADADTLTGTEAS